MSAITVSNHDSKTGCQPYPEAPEKNRVVIGVIGNDIHVVANRIFDLQLSDMGFEVINLSVNNQPRAFLNAAIEHNASAVLVSSLNGEAEYWCQDFRAMFDQAGLLNIVLYIGGNLSVGLATDADIEKQFKAFGFTRVYSRKGDPEQIGLDLLSDLSHDVSIP